MPANQQEIVDLEKKAENGDITAAVELGRRYFDGRGVPRDTEKARKLFEQSYAAGSSDGEVGLGYCYHQGIGVPEDPEHALKIWQKAADQGNAWGLLSLGGHYHRAGEYKLAVELFEKVLGTETASTRMKIEAAETLAYWHISGKGVPKDATKAVEYYVKAAEFGSTKAKSILGQRLWKGLGLPKNMKRGFEFLLQAAEEGNEIAATFLGHAYEWGDGIPANFVKAEEMYEQAVKNGSIVAPHLKLGITALALLEPSPVEHSANLYLPLDSADLKATDYYNIAYAADLSGDNLHAMQFYQRYKSASNSTDNPARRRDVDRIVYFRNQGVDDYFTVLASADKLRRMAKQELKVHIPGGAEGYSDVQKQIILESLAQWTSPLMNQLKVKEVEHASNANLKFLPVDREIFFGNAAARTCYLGKEGKKIIADEKQCAVQLPRYDVYSLDDRINYSTICLHETGHALGLSGHSIFASDVMFGTQSHIARLSPRDLHAITLLYTDKAEENIRSILDDQVKKNNPYALTRLGLHLYSNGRIKEAVSLLEKASEMENPDAQFTLARYYYYRKWNLKKAKILYDKAAVGGSFFAQVCRSTLPGLGKSLFKIEQEQLEAIRAAAEHGNTTALWLLGLIYTLGTEGANKDMQKATQFLKQATDQGSYLARCLLALNSLVSSAGKVSNRNVR